MSRGERTLADIAPDDFLSVWGASTYEEALKKAERAKTTTPTSERKRCPECRSQRVRRLSDKTRAKQQRKTDHDYLCTTCRHRFDTPVYGEEEVCDGDAGECGNSANVSDFTTDPVEWLDAGEWVTTGRDAFEWVDEDDLAEPPLTRQLADLDDRALTALAIYLYRPWSPTGPSYYGLEEIWPYSSTWVGDRVREWRDGAHRDLVRDPRPRLSLAVDAVEVPADD